MFIGKKTNQDKFFLKIQAKQTAKKWLTDDVRQKASTLGKLI